MKKQTVIKQRVLKDGKVHFYLGRNKATGKELKQYFRENLDIDKSKLTKEDAQQIGRIKGGLTRAKTAAQFRVKGKYIGGSYERAAKRLGINIDALVRATGANSLGEVFKNNKALEDRFNEIMSGVGLPLWFSPEKVIDLINDYAGKEIIINGEIVSKSQAKSIVRKVEQDVFRHFEPVGQALKVTYIGRVQMILDLPDFEDYEEADEKDFLEAYSNFYIIYTSVKNGKGKKG